MKKQLSILVVLGLITIPLIAYSQTSEQIAAQKRADSERAGQLEDDIQKDYAAGRLGAGQAKEREYNDLMTKEYPKAKATPPKQSQVQKKGQKAKEPDKRLFKSAQESRLGPAGNAQPYESAGSNRGSGGAK